MSLKAIQTQRGPITMKLSISNRLSLSCSLFLLFGLSLPAQAHAGTDQDSADSPETNVSERVRLLESELERQNTQARSVAKNTQRTTSDDSGSARQTLCATRSATATRRNRQSKELTPHDRQLAATSRTANTNRRTTTRESRRSGVEDRSSPIERRLSSTFRRHLPQRNRTHRSAARARAKRARPLSFPAESSIPTSIQTSVFTASSQPAR